MKVLHEINSRKLFLLMMLIRQNHGTAIWGKGTIRYWKVRNDWSSTQNLFLLCVLFEIFQCHIEKVELSCLSRQRCLRFVAKCLQVPNSGLNGINTSVLPANRMFSRWFNFFRRRRTSCAAYVAIHSVTKRGNFRNAQYQITLVSLKNLILNYNHRLLFIHLILYTRSCNVCFFGESHGIEFFFASLSLEYVLMPDMDWNFVKNVFSCL